jgi:hypothetical protein
MTDPATRVPAPPTAAPVPVSTAAAPDIAPLLALAEEARHAGRALEAAAALRALVALVPGDTRARAALARCLF